jgi:hypothetical protein
MTDQDTNEGQLTENQLMALPFIIAARSMTEAAEKAGISRNTLYEWQKNPAFKAELQRQREAVVEEALEQLKMNTVKAVDNLGALLDFQNVGFRRTVSLDILKHVLKARDQSRVANLEKKVAELEKRLSERPGTQTE